MLPADAPSPPPGGKRSPSPQQEIGKLLAKRANANEAAVVEGLEACGARSLGEADGTRSGELGIARITTSTEELERK